MKFSLWYPYGLTVLHLNFEWIQSHIDIYKMDSVELCRELRFSKAFVYLVVHKVVDKIKCKYYIGQFQLIFSIWNCEHQDWQFQIITENLNNST